MDRYRLFLSRASSVPSIDGSSAFLCSFLANEPKETEAIYFGGISNGKK